MKRIGWLIPFVLVVPLVAGAADDPVPLKARARLELPEVRTLALSDTVGVTLTLDGALAADVDELGKLPPDAAWSLVERRRDMSATTATNWTIHFAFAPRAPGEKVAFTFPPVRFRSGREEQTVTFEPAYFKVTTQIKDADLGQIRDITSIEPSPPVEPGDHSWLWWLALACGVLIALILAIVMRLLFHPSKRRTPASFALQEWNRLIAMKLAEQGKTERFITLLTTLVRRYLERQFAMPARRRTTQEFLQEVERTSAFTPEEKQFLSTFLQRCEAIKFANVEMTAAECHQWAELARIFFSRRSVV